MTSCLNGCLTFWKLNNMLPYKKKKLITCHSSNHCAAECVPVCGKKAAVYG